MLRRADHADVEHGFSDMENIPLISVQQDIQTRSSSKSKDHHNDKRAENSFFDNKPDQIYYEDTRPVTEQVIGTVYQESYDEHPEIKELLDAIERDDGNEINRLVKTGADVNSTYPLSMRQQEYLHKAVWDDFMDDYKKVPTWSRGRPAWSMLQYASAVCHVKSLRALLDCGSRPNDVHAQRTALDVVGAAFHYGYSIGSDQFSQAVAMLVSNGALASVVVYNGTVTSLHTAAWLRCARAAVALIRAGAPWSVDSDGLTPLHYAVKNKCEDMLQVLVSEGGKEVANSVSRTGASALFGAVTAQWAVGCAILLRNGALPDMLCVHPERSSQYWTITDKITSLHLTIERNNTKILDKILTLSKRKNVNCWNSNRETPLYTAIVCEHLACVKMLLQHGASLKNVSDKSNALHVAALNTANNTDILKYILENFDVSDLINELDDDGFGPIHKAVIACPEAVKMLLDKGADERLKSESTNEYFRWITPLHECARAGRQKEAVSASIILSYDRRTIDDMDATGHTPLIAAALCGADKVVSTIIRNGALLSVYSNGLEKQSAIEMITAKLPNPTNFLENIFNSFLFIEGSSHSLDSFVDYTLFTNESEKDPLKTVEEMVRCGHRKVLVHPLIETLLFLKWVNLVPIYFLLLGTYATFVLSLNLFVGMVFYYGDRKQDMPDSVVIIFWLDIALLYISVCFVIIQECIFMHARGLQYMRSLETWLKLGSVILSIALPPWLLYHGGTSHEAGAAVRHVVTAALLLAWLQMMFLVSRFPRWGYYVLMMAEVATNIAKILLTSIFLVVGFALSFMVQFRATPPFDDPFAAFIKTMTMMASEFDYEDLFGEAHDIVLVNAKTIVRVIFLLFLIFVSIVLMNFIVGVAVNDIHNLTVSGNVRRLEKQLDLICTLESLVCNGFLEKILPNETIKKINERRFVSKMVIHPGTTKIWTVHCEDEENNYEIQLPSHLYQATASLPSKAADTEFHTKKVHNMVKMLYDSIIKETIDPYDYRQYAGIRLKSKLDDIIQDMKKINDLKEDIRKLQVSHYDEERLRVKKQRLVIM